MYRYFPAFKKGGLMSAFLKLVFWFLWSIAWWLANMFFAVTGQFPARQTGEFVAECIVCIIAACLMQAWGGWCFALANAVSIMFLMDVCFVKLCWVGMFFLLAAGTGLLNKKPKGWYWWLWIFPVLTGLTIICHIIRG